MWVSDEKHGVFQTIQRAYILILNSIGWTESSSSGCRILPQSVCDFIYKSQLFKPSKQSEQELYIERTLLGAVFLSMSMIVLFLLYKCVRKCQKVQQGHNRRFRLSSGEHASSQSSSKSLSLSAVRTAPSGEICWRPCSSSPYQVCWRWVGVACLFAFLASLPWEFVRIYQQEVAKKAAVSLKEVPAECFPDNQTPVWKMAVDWLVRQFQWTDDPCQKYHEALLVDPFWEVTPLVVVCSVLTRCVLKPLELASTGLGDCLRLVLRDVPWQWQPLILILSTILTILLVAICCQYRIILPLLLNLEPLKRTPVIVRVRPNRRNEPIVIDSDSQDDSFSGDTYHQHSSRKL